MNNTPYLGLSQWEAEDRILRTDFNSDNEKIDAALASGARYVKLREIVTTEAAQSIEVDVSDIVFGDWQAIHVDACLVGQQVSKFYVNDVPANCTYHNMGSMNSNTGYLCSLSSNRTGRFEDRITFYPGRQGNRLLFMICGTTMGYSTSILFQNVTTLQFPTQAENALEVGTTITIWGEV